MTFAEKLKQIRIDNNLSQEQFAKNLGTTKQVISRYETGQRIPKISVIENFAEILNIPITYLLSDSVSTQKSPLLENLEQNEFLLLSGYRLLDKKKKKELLEKLRALLVHSAPKHTMLAAGAINEPDNKYDQKAAEIMEKLLGELEELI